MSNYFQTSDLLSKEIKRGLGVLCFECTGCYQIVWSQEVKGALQFKNGDLAQISQSPDKDMIGQIVDRFKLLIGGDIFSVGCLCCENKFKEKYKVNMRLADVYSILEDPDMLKTYIQ